MTDPGDLACRAAHLWGGGRLVPVAIRENAVFRLETPTGTLALRLHREGYQSHAAIAAELEWTAALAARGFPVPAPVAATDGARLVEIEGRAFSAVAWIDGAPVGRSDLPLPGSARDQADLFFAIGALAGQLHALTDALHLAPALPRPRWDRDGLLGHAPLWGPFWQHPAFDAADRAMIGRARALAQERLSDPALDFGLIHADLLRENLLMTPDGLALIDFDDSGYGFRAYDLGTAMVQNLEEPHLPRIAEALLEGYKAARPGTALGMEDLILFTMLRCLASCGWIMTRAAPGDGRQKTYAARALRLANAFIGNSASLSS